MANMPGTKAELLQELDKAWSEIQRVLQDWSSQQVMQWRDQAGWSIQDHLNHLAVWEEGIAALLEQQPRDQAMGIDRPTVESASEDELNAILRERTPPRTLDETRAALQQSHDHLLRALGKLNDSDLFKTYSYYQPDELGKDSGKPIIGWVEDSGRPIIGWIVGNSNGHYREHLPWMTAIAAQGE